MNLDKSNHSVFTLTYYLIVCVKYRKKVIDDCVGSAIGDVGERIAPHDGIALLEYNPDRDHVHLLLKARPNSRLDGFGSAFKSASSHLVKARLRGIRHQLWKKSFWSPSYCIMTTGGAPLETLREYVQTQGRGVSY